MHISQLVAKEMIKNKKGGSIVNVSSQASQAALDNHTIYCTTKAAVDHMTRMMALELGPHQVWPLSRIICIITSRSARTLSIPPLSSPIWAKSAGPSLKSVTRCWQPFPYTDFARSMTSSAPFSSSSLTCQTWSTALPCLLTAVFSPHKLSLTPWCLGSLIINWFFNYNFHWFTKSNFFHFSDLG